MDWLRIRNTDVSVLDVLEMLAENRSTEEILGRFPALSHADIASAAATARYLIIYHWAVCREPELALSPFPRPTSTTRGTSEWSEQQEVELRGLFHSGASIEELARIFMTMKSEIVERLKRLNTE